jgi:hypothetical protein
MDGVEAMTEAREEHLLRMVDDLRSLDEALEFRLQLQSQDEERGLVKVMLALRIGKLVDQS